MTDIVAELRATPAGQRIDRVLKSRHLRYCLLVPTALSVLAQMADLGQLAAWVLRLWDPIFNAISSVIDRVLPGWGVALTSILLFAPFIMTGVLRIKKGERTEHPITAVLGLNGFLLLLAAVGGRFEMDVVTAVMIQLIIAGAVLLFSLVTLFARRGLRFPTLIFTAVVWLSLLVTCTYRSDPWAAAISVIVVAPLINLPRLRDLFVVVATLSVVSVTCGYLASAIGV